MSQQQKKLKINFFAARLEREKRKASTTATMSISAYEQARLKNIAKNNIELKRLGLDAIQTLLPKQRGSQKRKKKSMKRKQFVTKSLPTRTSSRNKQKPKVNYTEITIIGDHADSDYDSEDSDAGRSESSDDDDDDDDDDYETLPPPSKKAKHNTSIIVSTTAKKLLTVEKAKTGRSSCRLCREIIIKDTPRVGMMSWIVGRNAVTWQHPSCFLSQLCVAAASNSKTKCKVTSVPFVKNQVKVGCKSHSTTSWVSLDALPTLLTPVLKIIGDEATLPSTLQGMDTLNQVQQHALQATIMHTRELYFEEKDQKQISTTESQSPTSNKAKKRVVLLGDISTQPKIGVKSNAKGPVSWKFGAYLCHGKLIASKETKTHCYARTHKGNVKTLKKGGTYWWMVDTQ